MYGAFHFACFNDPLESILLTGEAQLLTRRWCRVLHGVDKDDDRSVHFPTNTSHVITAQTQGGG